MKNIDKPRYPRRIHIAPVGYEIDRIVLPLIEMEADKVYLITEKKEKDDTGLFYVKEIENRLSKLKRPIEIEKRGTDIVGRDLYDTLRIYRQIAEEESGNHIFVNVSTGTKIHAIAGMMTCMIFRKEENLFTPYYAVPSDYDNEPEAGQQISIGCKEIKKMPNYRIEKPPDELIDVLEVLSKSRSKYNSISKKILIEELENSGMKLLNEKSKDGLVAKYNALQRKYIIPLIEWDYITLDYRGNRPVIKITPEGINALSFLKD
ncbi:MAG: hypothetical protein JW931_00245 [Methanomicrobiaceae archaeon]|nr:hypothetical protein [Methanomicrobiaceae archaeon]